jgi:hypothetical protein
MSATGDPGQAWWNYYVTLPGLAVILLTNRGSASYDPVFDANLTWCKVNLAYGFANYSAPAASNMSYQGQTIFT